MVVYVTVVVVVKCSVVAYYPLRLLITLPVTSPLPLHTSRITKMYLPYQTEYSYFSNFKYNCMSLNITPF